MNTHLKKLLARMSENQLLKAKHHQAMAEHCGQLMTLCKAHDNGNAVDEIAEAMRDAHTEMAQEDGEMGQACVECCKAMNESRKADGMRDGDELEAPPSGFRAIHDTVPPTAIPRFGAPPIHKSTVEPQFRQLIAVDEE